MGLRKILLILSLAFYAWSALANSDLWQFPYAENSTESRVGWYPGSYDPPHQGHLRVIRTSIEQLKLDTIYITVNGMTDKEYKSSIDERVRMVKAMLDGQFPNVNVVVSVEPMHGKRPLVRQFIERHGKGNVHAIFGTDTIQLNWSRMGDIEGFNYVLNLRAAYDVDVEGIDESRLGYINSGPAVTSSSQVRKDILETGTSEILGPNVKALVEEQKLYSVSTRAEQEYFISKRFFIGQRIKRKFPEIKLPKEPLVPIAQQTESAYDDLIIRQILKNNKLSYDKQKEVYRFFKELLAPQFITLYRAQHERNKVANNIRKFNPCFSGLHRAMKSSQLVRSKAVGSRR